jgi:ABC-type transport system substrate-binding protein
MFDMATSISRRAWLRLAAGSLAVGSAGCAADGSSVDDGDGGGTTTTPQPGWYSDDDRLTITVAAPDGPRGEIARTVAETLGDFGIDTDTRIQAADEFRTTIQDGAFTIAVGEWGTHGPSRHPYTFYRSVYSSESAERLGMDPTAISVPMPVGDESGDHEPVDVVDRLQRLGEALNDHETLTAELAWIYNHHLPVLPLYTAVDRATFTTDDWTVPEPSSPAMRVNPVAGALRRGAITRRQEGDDDVFTIATRQAGPSSMQWNPYYREHAVTTFDRLVFEPLLSVGSPPNGVDGPDEPAPELAEYELEPGRVVVTVADDRVWSDGDRVTAQDLLLQFELEQLLGRPSGNLWDSVDRDGDQLTFDIGGRNPRVVVPKLLHRRLRTKRGTQFEEWHAALDDAAPTDISKVPNWVPSDEGGDEGKLQSLREEVASKPLDDHPTYGLWQPTSVTTDGVRLETNPNHPRSDAIDYDAVELEALPERAARSQALVEDRLDALFEPAARSRTAEAVPEHTVERRYDAGRGPALLFNHGQAPFDDHRLRQAVASLLNRRQLGRSSGHLVTTIEAPVGLPNRVATSHLNEYPDRYRAYGPGSSQPEKAISLLEAAGYGRRK